MPASETWVWGISSRLPDGRHVLLVDVDGADLEQLTRRCIMAIAAHRLPDVRILATSTDHWHVLAACSRPAHEIVRIMRELGADSEHIRLGRRAGHWVLRTESLPEARIVHAALLRSPHPPEAAARDLRRVRYPRLTQQEDHDNG